MKTGKGLPRIPWIQWGGETYEATVLCYLATAQWVERGAMNQSSRMFTVWRKSQWFVLPKVLLRAQPAQPAVQRHWKGKERMTGNKKQNNENSFWTSE